MAASFLVRGTLSIVGLALFFYVLWLSNEANRGTLKMLRSASWDMRHGQFKQQEMLNRIEYRLAKTSSQYEELMRTLGPSAEEKIADAMDSHTPYQSALQKAGTALQLSDVHTAMEVLTETNHELLNKLKEVEELASDNSTHQRKIKADIKAEVEAQAKLQEQIDEADKKMHDVIKVLEEKFPDKVGTLVTQLSTVDADLQAASNEMNDVTKLHRDQVALTERHYDTIAKLALEQRFGDDPPKVGSTLCFSSIMQSDIDSGQAQIVSRLYRKMCDKYVQFGEGQLLVTVEDSLHDEPYILGEHVIALELTEPSSHAENWEKLNTAVKYIHTHFFEYDFYLKVDPDTYFFAGNYQYFMAYMSRKWGQRFVDEPLYAGLPLHHNAPSYNSGHVYILNRKAVTMLVAVLDKSRVLHAANNGDGHQPLLCKWGEPQKDSFLSGCSQMCLALTTLHAAQHYCELVPDCKGIVDIGDAAEEGKRYQLRSSDKLEASATGEVAYQQLSCPEKDEEVAAAKITAECAFALRTPEDLQLGHCFHSLGVRTWDTRDNKGREFLSFTDPKTWSQGFPTVMTVPWYYRGRYFDNYGTIAKHLADHIVSIHVGYDPTLKHCWAQIYDTIVAMEPGSDYGRKTVTTEGAIGEWFDNHRYELLGTPLCPDR